MRTITSPSPVLPTQPAQPTQRYSFQMLQASLRTPAFPITAYSQKSLNTKQAQWTEDTARSSAELLRAAHRLETAAKLFQKENPNSVLHKRREDKDAILKQLTSFLEKLNAFQQMMDSSPHPWVQMISEGWKRFTDSKTWPLSRMGITQSENGLFVLDEERLRAAMQSDFSSVVRVLSGTGGFVNHVEAQLDRLQQAASLLYGTEPYAAYDNPYHAYLLPRLFLQQAAASGLFIHQAW